MNLAGSSFDTEQSINAVQRPPLSLSLSRASQDFPKALVFREKHEAIVSARDETVNLNLETI